VLPKTEGLTPAPLSPYAVAKLAGEGYARSFHAVYGLETISLRYFNVFGPRQDPFSQYSAVIPNFITAFLENRSPTIFGDGEQSRDFTFVANVVEANIRAMEAKGVSGGVYNIAMGRRTSLNQLVDALRALTGRDITPDHEPSRLGDVIHSVASIERAQTDLQYEPVVGFEEGLSRSLEHYTTRSELPVT
jgi:nucleoside-diphosphate-sugar epimerase